MASTYALPISGSSTHSHHGHGHGHSRSHNRLIAPDRFPAQFSGFNGASLRKETANGSIQGHAHSQTLSKEDDNHTHLNNQPNFTSNTQLPRPQLQANGSAFKVSKQMDTHLRPPIAAELPRSNSYGFPSVDGGSVKPRIGSSTHMWVNVPQRVVVGQSELTMHVDLGHHL